MKQLLLGNQAVARGAWEAGVRVATAYPGTPSTEITEEIAKFPEIKAEWAPNEKVAMETAAGASIAGARSMVCMKHVGMNVAADPLFTLAYTGINGGMMVVVADDPGMFSSQNEQDSRYYARAAHLPMLEPSSSDEALKFTKLAFELSEKYDTPVMLRMVTRIAHSRSVADMGDRVDVPLRDYVKNVDKYVMMPAQARGRHLAVEAREIKLSEDVNSFDINYAEYKSDELGVVTSGTCWQYVKEALPDASVFKLGMVYPLPVKAIAEFASRVKKLVVVEELEPFIEDTLHACGIECEGKSLFGIQGELSKEKIAEKLGDADAPAVSGTKLPARPPVLCPGCPHRAVYYVLNKLRMTVFGDIGCYTLGANAPLSSVDTCICMGAGIGVLNGYEKARGHEAVSGAVAVIGDSTFLHSGMTGLLDMVYNGGTGTVIILDNRTTGMTGHQPHPGTGKNIYGEPAPAVDFKVLCSALGVRNIVEVDPFDIKTLEKTIKEETARPEPSVIIAKRPCALLERSRALPDVITDKCRACGACMRIGCPAIIKGEKMRIDPTLCIGCGLCEGLCAFGAIEKGGAK